ncbi:hypothetical protein ACIQU6_43320 [Streptomyces sp. NPDC090442]|uniref:hypothetical protein n=1 Tax=Streptomyces sp. NPDC090442 TaxID=3365962 RepID=UPI003817A90B
MSWEWRFEGPKGNEVSLEVDESEFSTQGDAETWIGENWRGLSDQGVIQVSLLEDGKKIGEAMSLVAPDRDQPNNVHPGP